MKQEKIKKTVDILTKISGICGAISAITVAAVNIIKVIYPIPQQQNGISIQNPKI